MMSEVALKEIIEKVILEMDKNGNQVNTGGSFAKKSQTSEIENVSDDSLRDITKKSMQDTYYVPKAANEEQYKKYKKSTPARLGIWRAGTRLNTETMLRFRADHAVAQDAVFSDVSDEFLKEMNLKTYQTKCEDKDMFITRPDLGRTFSEEILSQIKADCKNSPKVQIYMADGLSSTAIEANVKDTLPAIINGLKNYGIETGTPFFVKYGRVGSEDAIGEALNAEVTCVLIGERPGLATGESMSAYIVYKTYPGIPEAKRTVVSNIHKNGTPAAEAGAHIAEVIKKVLDAKASGVDLKL